jgi:hypothetical protein
VYDAQPLFVLKASSGFLEGFLKRHAVITPQQFLEKLAYPTMPVGFADSFDGARYGGAQAVIASAEPGSIAAVIAAELEREPYPLTRRELRIWADLLWALYSRLRDCGPFVGKRESSAA